MPVHKNNRATIEKITEPTIEKEDGSGASVRRRLPGKFLSLGGKYFSLGLRRGRRKFILLGDG